MFCRRLELFLGLRVVLEGHRSRSPKQYPHIHLLSLPHHKQSMVSVNRSIECVGLQTCHLDLPSFMKTYPVFHVSRRYVFGIRFGLSVHAPLIGHHYVGDATFPFKLELNFSHPLKFESPKSFNDTTKLRKLASEQSTRPNHRLMNDHSLIPQILDIVLLRLMSMIIAKDKLHFHKILTWKPRTLPMAGEVLETGYGLYIG